MKSVIFATLLIAALSSSIEFSQDSNEGGFIGVLTKGFFNPAMDGESKIESFLRLANELIPLAEVEGHAAMAEGSKLGYSRHFCTGSEGDIFNACFFASAELWIGWHVNQTGTIGTYQVTYTPFTFLRAGGNVSVESYPAEVGYGGYVSIVDITIPIFASIGTSGICYSGDFNFAPGSFFTQISTSLLECYKVLTPVANIVCNKVFGPNFQHLTFTLWNGFNTDFLGHNCINF